MLSLVNICFHQVFIKFSYHPVQISVVEFALYTEFQGKVPLDVPRCP